MHVRIAHLDDIPAWLALAVEAEPLFGPMVNDQGFMRALEKNIARQTAFCVRVDDGAPGAPLMGGLLLAQPARSKVALDWLAVAQRWQRRGVGSALVEHAAQLVQPPGEIVVLTFAEAGPVGQAARRFYERLGFRPSELGPHNAAGIPTQVFRRAVDLTPTARAVIQRGDRVLLTQHHYVNPANLGKWSLPGGRLDPSDQDQAAALRRELREELGTEIDIFRFVGTFEHNGRLHHVSLVRLHNDSLTIDESEIAGAAWFTVEQVLALNAEGRLLAPFILQAVLAAHDPTDTPPEMP